MKVDQLTCTVEAPAEAVDAGSAVTLEVRVAAAGGESLDGARASIRDASGAEVALADLARGEGGVYESGEIELQAPVAAGEHVYRAVVLAPDKARSVQPVAAAEFSIVVQAHAAQLTVWDVPPAIPAGERFGLKVGLRCSAGCDLSGQGLLVVDQDGGEIGRATLRRDPWPDTDALYFAEVDVAAPTAVGLSAWEIRTGACDHHLPHAAGSIALSVRTVAAPDCVVVLTAIDRETQAPIVGAIVVMHPFRATTDAKGIATLAAPKGQYDVMISGSRYIPVATTIDVGGDVSTTAELDADPTWKSDHEIIE